MSDTKHKHRVGRPPMFSEPQQYHNVRLPHSYATLARRLGAGNLSAGV